MVCINKSTPRRPPPAALRPPPAARRHLSGRVGDRCIYKKKQ